MFSKSFNQALLNQSKFFYDSENESPNKMTELPDVRMGDSPPPAVAAPHTTSRRASYETHDTHRHRGPTSRIDSPVSLFPSPLKDSTGSSQENGDQEVVSAQETLAKFDAVVNDATISINRKYDQLVSRGRLLAESESANDIGSPSKLASRLYDTENPLQLRSLFETSLDGVFPDIAVPSGESTHDLPKVSVLSLQNIHPPITTSKANEIVNKLHENAEKQRNNNPRTKHVKAVVNSFRLPTGSRMAVSSSSRPTPSVGTVSRRSGIQPSVSSEKMSGKSVSPRQSTVTSESPSRLGFGSSSPKFVGVYTSNEPSVPPIASSVLLGKQKINSKVLSISKPSMSGTKATDSGAVTTLLDQPRPDINALFESLMKESEGKLGNTNGDFSLPTSIGSIDQLKLLSLPALQALAEDAAKAGRYDLLKTIIAAMHNDSGTSFSASKSSSSSFNNVKNTNGDSVTNRIATTDIVSEPIKNDEAAGFHKNLQTSGTRSRTRSLESVKITLSVSDSTTSTEDSSLKKKETVERASTTTHSRRHSYSNVRSSGYGQQYIQNNSNRIKSRSRSSSYSRAPVSASLLSTESNSSVARTSDKQPFQFSAENLNSLLEEPSTAHYEAIAKAIRAFEDAQRYVSGSSSVSSEKDGNSISKVHFRISSSPDNAKKCNEIATSPPLQSSSLLLFEPPSQGTSAVHSRSSSPELAAKRVSENEKKSTPKTNSGRKFSPRVSDLSSRPEWVHIAPVLSDPDISPSEAETGVEKIDDSKSKNESVLFTSSPLSHSELQQEETQRNIEKMKERISFIINTTRVDEMNVEEKVVIDENAENCDDVKEVVENTEDLGEEQYEDMPPLVAASPIKAERPNYTVTNTNSVLNSTTSADFLLPQNTIPELIRSGTRSSVSVPVALAAARSDEDQYNRASFDEYYKRKYLPKSTQDPTSSSVSNTSTEKIGPSMAEKMSKLSPSHFRTSISPPRFSNSFGNAPPNDVMVTHRSESGMEDEGNILNELIKDMHLVSSHSSGDKLMFSPDLERSNSAVLTRAVNHLTNQTLSTSDQSHHGTVQYTPYNVVNYGFNDHTLGVNHLSKSFSIPSSTPSNTFPTNTHQGDRMFGPGPFSEGIDLRRVHSHAVISNNVHDSFSKQKRTANFYKAVGNLTTDVVGEGTNGQVSAFPTPTSSSTSTRKLKDWVIPSSLSASVVAASAHTSRADFVKSLLRNQLLDSDESLRDLSASGGLGSRDLQEGIINMKHIHNEWSLKGSSPRNEHSIQDSELESRSFDKGSTHLQSDTVNLSKKHKITLSSGIDRNAIISRIGSNNNNSILGRRSSIHTHTSKSSIHNNNKVVSMSKKRSVSVEAPTYRRENVVSDATDRRRSHSVTSMDARARPSKPSSHISHSQIQGSSSIKNLNKEKGNSRISSGSRIPRLSNCDNRRVGGRQHEDGVEEEKHFDSDHKLMIKRNIPISSQLVHSQQSPFRQQPARHNSSSPASSLGTEGIEFVNEYVDRIAISPVILENSVPSSVISNNNSGSGGGKSDDNIKKETNQNVKVEPNENKKETSTIPESSKLGSIPGLTPAPAIVLPTVQPPKERAFRARNLSATGEDLSGHVHQITKQAIAVLGHPLPPTPSISSSSIAPTSTTVSGSLNGSMIYPEENKNNNNNNNNISTFQQSTKPPSNFQQRDLLSPTLGGGRVAAMQTAALISFSNKDQGLSSSTSLSNSNIHFHSTEVPASSTSQFLNSLRPGPLSGYGGVSIPGLESVGFQEEKSILGRKSVDSSSFQCDSGTISSKDIDDFKALAERTFRASSHHSDILSSSSLMKVNLVPKGESVNSFDFSKKFAFSSTTQSLKSIGNDAISVLEPVASVSNADLMQRFISERVSSSTSTSLNTTTSSESLLPKRSSLVASLSTILEPLKRSSPHSSLQDSS